MSKKKKKSPASTNLLIGDSFSESDENDVPDLELIPPLNAPLNSGSAGNSYSGRLKKKRFTKFKKNRSGPAESEESLDNIGFPSSASGMSLSRGWVCSLSLLLFSLVIAVVVLTWFTVGLCYEVARIRNTTAFGQTSISGDQSAAAKIEIESSLAAFRKEMLASCCKPFPTVVSLTKQPDFDANTVIDTLDLLKQQLKELKESIGSEQSTNVASVGLTEVQSEIKRIDFSISDLTRRVELMNVSLSRIDQCACQPDDQVLSRLSALEHAADQGQVTTTAAAQTLTTIGPAAVTEIPVRLETTAKSEEGGTGGKTTVEAKTEATRMPLFPSLTQGKP